MHSRPDEVARAFIDVEIANLRGKKSKSLGIVEVNGNRMILALAKEGDERPKTTEEADNVTVYYFQTSPPPPRTEFRIVAMTVGKEEAAEKELNKLSQEGFEFVSTTQPVAADAKSSVTTIHFLLKRTREATVLVLGRSRPLQGTAPGLDAQDKGEGLYGARGFIVARRSAADPRRSRGLL